MKKQTTFYYAGKPYTIERGRIYVDNGDHFRLFKIVGKRNDYLFKLREFNISKSCNAYPVKGEKGIRYLTISETADFLIYNNSLIYNKR